MDSVDALPDLAVLGVPQPSADAEAWRLVLASQGIDSRVARAEGGWVVVVPAERAEAAARAIGAWRAENRPEPPPPPETAAGSLAGVWLAVGLVAAHAWVALGPGRGWRVLGAADAAAIRSGEAWRALTALTLHADWAHVASNALSGAAFVTVVARSVGPGLGVLLVLLAGVLGNLADAALRADGFRALGASTAVFGALGVLGGLRAVQALALPRAARAAWVPLAAAAAMLALLGSSEQTDVVAHLFGMVAGVPLGALAARVPAGLRRRGAFQLAAGLAAAGATVWAWARALALA